MIYEVLDRLIYSSCKKHHKVEEDGKCYGGTGCIATLDEVKEVNPNLLDVSKGCCAYKLLKSEDI